MPKYEYLHLISRIEDVATAIRNLPNPPLGVTFHLEEAIAKLTMASNQQNCTHSSTESGVDDFYYGVIEYTRCNDCGETLKHSRIT